MLRTKQIVSGPNFRTLATKKGKLLRKLRSGRILGNILYTIYDGDDGAIFTEKPLITTQQCTWFFLSKMASVVGCLIVIGFFQGSVLGEQQQNTLNVPQVLLPYAPRGSVHTNFTLKALQGCYLWQVQFSCKIGAILRY